MIESSETMGLTKLRKLFSDGLNNLNEDCSSLVRPSLEIRDELGACAISRIMSHLHSFEKLFQADLPLEAEIVLRSCLEAVFFLGSLVESDEAVQHLITDSQNYNPIGQGRSGHELRRISP